VSGGAETVRGQHNKTETACQRAGLGTVACPCSRNLTRGPQKRRTAGAALPPEPAPTKAALHEAAPLTPKQTSWSLVFGNGAVHSPTGYLRQTNVPPPPGGHPRAQDAPPPGGPLPLRPGLAYY